jgi:PAS domain S-box-containing protein
VSGGGDAGGSDDRLQLALEAGRMGMWEWDLPSGRVSWSPTLERMHGLEPGSFGGTFEDFHGDIHPDDRERVLRSIAESLAGPHGHDVEYRILPPDGGMRWVEGRGLLVRDGDGRPLRMVGVCIDVTERKRIEEALGLLAEANSVLSASLDPGSMLEGVAGLLVGRLADHCLIDMEKDEGLRRVAVRSAADREDLLREALPGVTDAGWERHLRHPIVRAIRTGETQVFSRVSAGILDDLEQGPGSRAALERLGLLSVLVVPLVARGKTRGAITLLSSALGRHYRSWDVSLAEELARRVALAVDNLYLYQDARQAVRARDEVLAVVSHDLRNLLNPLAMSAAQMLAATPPAGRRTLEVMQRAVDQMGRLIQDLLDVARLEDGRLVLERERLQPGAVIADVVELHRTLADQKALRLEAAVAEIPEVEADRHRLLRVLANLVANALKFTPAGGLVVVGAERFTDGREVRFYVSDTGPGIAEQDRPHLFVPFWQASPQAREGSGLGLAITKRLVEAHGGSIWVDSAPGGGCVFSFTLAAAPAPR